MERRSIQSGQQLRRRPLTAVAIPVAIVSVALCGPARAIVPPGFAVEEIAPSGSFVGTVELSAGQATDGRDPEGHVCGVTYTARVLETVRGEPDSKELALHVLRDVRPELSFLEVGSRYFVIAVPRAKHEFRNLSDGLIRFPEPPEACHASSTAALYVAREFSGKIHRGREVAEGIPHLRSSGLGLIEGTQQLRQVWWSEGDQELVVSVRSPQEAALQRLYVVGIVLEDLLELFAPKPRTTPEP